MTFLSHGTKLAVAVFGAALLLPAATMAQDYDGYCYQRKKDAGHKGAIIGAIIGGAIGSQVSKNERGLGTVGGAVIGGSIGHNAGKNSVKCYNGQYYSYENGYYDPPPAPDGYGVVYYNSRPSRDYYDSVETRQAYRDGYDRGYRSGRSNRDGWYDDDGYWHEGRR